MQVKILAFTFPCKRQNYLGSDAYLVKASNRQQSMLNTQWWQA